MYAESAAIPRSGFAGAVTGTPLACSRAITPFQLDASANAPWTRTTLAASGVVVSDIRAPFAASAQRPEGGAHLGREEVGLLTGGKWLPLRHATVTSRAAARTRAHPGPDPGRASGRDGEDLAGPGGCRTSLTDRCAGAATRA